MLDIVATIQLEQDELIRLPQAGIVAVQGGPGTGKTAVGLHRAAFLLYGNDVLARAGVLVVGPNRTFLRYIGQVLPSLGEEAVVQATLSDLVPEVHVRGVDTTAAARIKGDPRMYEVIAASLVARRRSLGDQLEVRVAGARLRLSAAEVDEIVAAIVERDAPHNAGRAGLREQLARAVLDANRAVVDRLGVERSRALDEVPARRRVPRCARPRVADGVGGHCRARPSDEPDRTGAGRGRHPRRARTGARA